MSTVDVIDVKGKKSGSVDLPGALFDVQTNVPLIHQVVVAQHVHIVIGSNRGFHAYMSFLLNLFTFTHIAQQDPA